MRALDRIAVIGGTVLGACSGSSNVVPPAPVEHLYVGDDATLTSLREYRLPLSASSLPIVALPVIKPFLIGLNSTTLAVTDLVGDIRLFRLPLDANSFFFATVSSTSSGTPVFLGATLLQGGSSAINSYTPPFTDSSTPSGRIPTPGVSPSYLTADPNGTLYESTGANTIGVVAGTSFTILTADTNVAFRGLAATASQLFACGFDGPANRVFIYALPLTETAKPAITIDLGDAGPEACVLDRSGNLYVGSPDGRIFVYHPPFSNGSIPVLTLATPAVIFGMAIGP